MSEILNDLLQKVYNLPENEVASLYKLDEEGKPTNEYAENALDVILQKDAERVAALKGKPVDTTELYNKAVKETEGKIHSKWEESLRADYPTVDPERKLRGDALRLAVKEFRFQQQEIPDVKNHPEFLSLEQRAQKALEEERESWQKKFEEQEQTFIQRQQWEGITKDIRSYFFGSGFVLPEDKVKQEAHFEDFVPKFQGFKFQRNADGTILVMNPDGSRVENQHGHPIFLHDLVLLKGKERYEVMKQPPVGSAGNDNGGKPTVSYSFKDEKDYMIQYNAVPASDYEKREAMYKSWEAQQNK
jgi:hypothetical protein